MAVQRRPARVRPGAPPRGPTRPAVVDRRRSRDAAVRVRIRARSCGNRGSDLRSGSTHAQTSPQRTVGRRRSAMTESTTTQDQGEMGSSTEDTFGWSEPEQASSSTGQQAREWLAQLQAMIENLATQAAPVVREVGAKAAELAAIAGEKAGPLAQRAAVFTEQAGHKIAERSRDLAEELRRDAAAAKAANASPTEETAEAHEPAEMTGEPMSSDESTTSGVA